MLPDRGKKLTPEMRRAFDARARARAAGIRQCDCGALRAWPIPSSRTGTPPAGERGSWSMVKG
jgi:hypothetical protein